MKLPKKSLGAVGALGALASAIYASQDHLDKRYADKSIEIRVAYNELESIYQRALSNKYFYEDQARKYPNNLSIKRKLNESTQEVKSIKKKLDQLDLQKRNP